MNMMHSRCRLMLCTILLLLFAALIPISQSINQSVSQSINQSVSQSINQSINQSHLNVDTSKPGIDPSSVLGPTMTRVGVSVDQQGRLASVLRTSCAALSVQSLSALVLIK
ncbi:hypothetical protein BD289DRAFT_277571 [Coniella lustricola]|uniref:Uncharacterized protein n=1 Tax=Coniella lustricola TaxID=2025994 RepID=A0A2T3A6K2_9PEZI|nr:hypothetical protein BD289DRAFT_277571 [Coniella lustricola]